MVDARDLKSLGACPRTSSILVPGTKDITGVADIAKHLAYVRFINCGQDCAHLRFQIFILPLCCKPQVCVIHNTLSLKDISGFMTTPSGVPTLTMFLTAVLFGYDILPWKEEIMRPIIGLCFPKS